MKKKNSCNFPTKRKRLRGRACGNREGQKIGSTNDSDKKDSTGRSQMGTERTGREKGGEFQ